LFGRSRGRHLENFAQVRLRIDTQATRPSAAVVGLNYRFMPYHWVLFVNMRT